MKKIAKKRSGENKPCERRNVLICLTQFQEVSNMPSHLLYIDSARHANKTLVTIVEEHHSNTWSARATERERKQRLLSSSRITSGADLVDLVQKTRRKTYPQEDGCAGSQSTLFLRLCRTLLVLLWNLHGWHGSRSHGIVCKHRLRWFVD